MAIATKFTRGDVAGNGWTTPANATADDGTYTTAAPAKNQTKTGDWDFDAFSDAEIPAGSTINNVVLEVQWKVSTTSSVATLGCLAIKEGATEGETVVTTEPTTDTLAECYFYSGAPTELQLKTAGALGCRVRASRGNTNTAFTASLDYVKITVDYTASANVNVTPAAASLSLSTFAPTVSASDNKTVAPGAATLTLTTFASTVTTSDHKNVAPGAASLTLATFAPVVEVSSPSVNVTPAAASITITTFAPTVTTGAHINVTPAAASLALAGFAPTVTTTAHVNVLPAAAVLNLTTFAPTVIWNSQTGMPASRLASPGVLEQRRRVAQAVRLGFLDGSLEDMDSLADSGGYAQEQVLSHQEGGVLGGSNR